MGCTRRLSCGCVKTLDLRVRGRSVCDNDALDVCDDGTKQYTIHRAPLQPNTVRLSKRMRLSKAHSLGHIAAD